MMSKRSSFSIGDLVVLDNGYTEYVEMIIFVNKEGWCTSTTLWCKDGLEHTIKFDVTNPFEDLVFLCSSFELAKKYCGYHE